MHYGTYSTSGRQFKTLLIDKKMDKAPRIVEQFTRGEVKMLRSDDGREFVAEVFEKRYGPVKVNTQRVR